MDLKTGPDQTPGSTPSPRILSSWKEIAQYLQIDVRTCQRWETAFGLPVHRLGQSSRSRVIAYRDELDDWRARTYRSRAGSRPPENTAAKPSGRRWFWPVTIVILALTAVGFVAFDRIPSGFRIRDSKLIITNRFGLRIWSFETGLATLSPASYYRDRFQVKSYRSTSAGDFPLFPSLIVRDFDGDGKREVLFIPRTREDGEPDAGNIILLDHRGTERWRFQIGRDTIVGSQSYAPNFVANLLEVGDFNGDGRPEILAGAHGFNEAPTRIVLLDLNGALRGEYWNFGQLTDATWADFEGDGKPEIVLVGQNNEYGGPAIVVLDPADMRGASPQSPAAKFAGLPEGTEKFYAVFPSMEIDKARSARGSFASIRHICNGHFFVQTTSLLRIDLAPGLHPPQVVLTDQFIVAYREAARAKLVPADIDRPSFIRDYLGQIRFFSRGEWVARPALSHPAVALAFGPRRR
jgi:hypothetical protein